MSEEMNRFVKVTLMCIVIFMMIIVVIAVHSVFFQVDKHKLCEDHYGENYAYNVRLDHPSCVLRAWDEMQQEYVVVDVQPIPESD